MATDVGALGLFLFWENWFAMVWVVIAAFWMVSAWTWKDIADKWRRRSKVLLEKMHAEHDQARP